MAKAPQKLQVEPKSGPVALQGSQEAPSWVQEAPKRLQVELRRYPSKAKELQNSSPRALVQQKSHELEF